MGVALKNLVEAEKIELDSLFNKAIAVDAFNWIYQFLSIIRLQTGEPLRDSKGNITSHLSGLFFRNMNLLKHGIKPVYVFDGVPPKFKEKTILEREKRKEEARKLLEATGDIKYAQQTAELTEDMIKESKELLEAMGIPYVDAPSEGEAEAAYLVRKGVVWASASQDWDSLLFGSPRLVRNLNITGRRKLPGKDVYITIYPELIELEKVLSELGINRDQLILIGMIIGNDFIDGIKGYGPKKAYKLVKEHSKDEIFKKFGWGEKEEEVFQFFKNPPVVDVEVKFGSPNWEKIKKILVDEHEFSEDRIDKQRKEYEEAKGRLNQTSLSRFF